MANIRILIILPGVTPYPNEIPHKPDSLQRIVGGDGDIEVLYPFDMVLYSSVSLSTRFSLISTCLFSISDGSLILASQLFQQRSPLYDILLLFAV